MMHRKTIGWDDGLSTTEQRLGNFSLKKFFMAYYSTNKNLCKETGRK